MSATPGTLLQYFQPPKKTSEDNKTTPETDIPQQSKRKSDAGETRKIGKRRKLSLATLREKQASIPAVIINNEHKENLVASVSIKSKGLFVQTAKESNTSVEKVMLKSAKDVLLQNQKNSEKKVINGLKIKSRLSTSPKEKKLNKVVCKLAKVEIKDSDMMNKNYKEKQTNSSKKLKYPKEKSKLIPTCDVLSIDSSSGEEEFKLYPKNNSTSKRKSLNIMRSDSDSDKSNSRSFSSAINCSVKDQLTGSTKPGFVSSKAERRSSRVRKQVERFVIEDDSDDGLKIKSKKKKGKNKDNDAQKNSKNQQTSRNSAKMKDREDKDSADITIISDNPRRSVSSVLGVAKKADPPLPRQSSHSLMQEAKKMMQLNTTPRVCTSVHNNCSVKSLKSTEKVFHQEVWPRISHVNVTNEIIIYPTQELELNKEPEDLRELGSGCPAASFTYPVDRNPHLVQGTQHRSYDECVDELVSVSTKIEDLIEHYRCTVRVQHDTSPIQVSELTEDQPWSKIYCPVDYKYCIGNKVVTKQLYKWLDNWKTKLLNTKKSNRSSDYSSDESDFVWSDEEGEVRWLDNVVMLTGPCGVGKSGVISTLAKQLGFKIMELNASSARTGKHVAEQFSEASQSHSVSGQSGSADFTKIMADIAQRNKMKKERPKRGLDNFFNKKEEGSKKTDVIDVDSKKSKRSRRKSSNQGKLSFNKDKTKKQKSDKTEKVKSDVKVDKLSLIVVEEIDIAFEEDRGFYTAIIALTQIAKRPIILTTNIPNISLPTDAGFLVLDFQPPRVESAMSSFGALSLSWNNYIKPYQLQQFAQYHNSDIRRCLNHLEFLNVSSKSRTNVSELNLVSHMLGITGLKSDTYLNCRQIVLEQTQEANIQYVYFNLMKCLKLSQQDSSQGKMEICEDVCEDALESVNQNKETGEYISENKVTGESTSEKEDLPDSMSQKESVCEFVSEKEGIPEYIPQKEDVFESMSEKYDTCESMSQNGDNRYLVSQKDKQNLLRWLVSCDTFVELDMLSTLAPETQWELYPMCTSSSLMETTKHCAEETPSTVPYRAAIENQLLSTLKVDLVDSSCGRVNRFKLKEEKHLTQINNTYKTCHVDMVSNVNLLSRCKIDELSALRGICRTEKLREDAHTKRRFLHYLPKSLDIKYKVLLSEYFMSDR